MKQMHEELATPGVKKTHELERALKKVIEGEVRFDDGARALYATDASNYRQEPIGVVVPKNKRDIIETVRLCHEFRVPVLSRGGGTSLAGQTCNTAVVIDMSKYYNQILELNPDEKYARVQPGIVLDELRNAAEKFQITFGPDPATHTRCTLGGMMGNNSCGSHALMAGKTVDNVIELEVLTYDGVVMTVGETSDAELEKIIMSGSAQGRVYVGLKRIRDEYGDLIREKYPDIPRRVSGYNLDQLLPENHFHVAKALVGTESTCVVILEAKLRLVDSPQCRALTVLGFQDIYTAADLILEILKFKPIACEALDEILMQNVHAKDLHRDYWSLMPEGKAFLAVEFGANSETEVAAQAEALAVFMRAKGKGFSARVFTDKKEQTAIWEIRESGLGATALVPGQSDTWEGWEDSAVHPKNLGQYLRDLNALYKKYGYRGALYGHFGQGCVHTRINFDFLTAGGIDRFRSFGHDAARLVVSLGGSLSGEHGDGQSRAELLPIMYGEKLIRAFEEFKGLWDPHWMMNPGKVVKPFRMDQNLRYGTSYAPEPQKTHFQYPEDRGSFVRATQRCVGVGACRRHDQGTMCPSYMVTREEKHSTRGRARMLFEMLEGDIVKKGWRDPHVKEALDLCLSCKGCKKDCPVNVDMATYKSEFLAQYYKGRFRPLQAYTMGLISRWSRLTSPIAGLANFVTQTKGLSSIAKWVTGMSQKRTVPAFARENFKTWFFKRPVVNQGKPPVILWADTFNNYFHPDVAKAAVEVLEDAGFQVKVPRPHLCCGRPLYDYGMLDKAKQWLQEILETLRDDIRRGVPVVGLEPSCTAVFRDEMMGLFPHDQDAWRLKNQTYILSEFLEQRVHDYRPPKLDRKAVVQGHCHHKAIMRIKDEESVMKKLGLDFELLDSGCCGMAGAFGFEPAHYDVSVAVGERKLLPKIRGTAKQDLIITNGFSCREQIRQLGGRDSLHLAEVIKMALDLSKATGLTNPKVPLVDHHGAGPRAFNREPPPIDAGRLSP